MTDPPSGPDHAAATPRTCGPPSAGVRYHVTVPDGVVGRPDGGRCTVDVVDRPDGTLEVRLDGRRLEVDVVPAGGALSVRVDGRVIDLTTEGDPTDWDVVASGERARARVESERARAGDPAGLAGRGEAGRAGAIVKSPMPGRVVKVLCAPGDAVEAGQALVVLEAMKMENEVRARGGGTVARVHVTVGEAVDRNATLVTLATLATLATIACLAALALV